MNAKRKTANAKRKTANAKRKTAWNGGSFYPKATIRDSERWSFLPLSHRSRQSRCRPQQTARQDAPAQRLSPIHNSPQGRKMPFSDLNLVERRKITTFADNIIIQRT